MRTREGRGGNEKQPNMDNAITLRSRNLRAILKCGLCGLVLLLGGIGLANAQDPKPSYPAMAPIAQYQMASPSEEIALARSAAPASISRDATVLTFGADGYQTAVTGKNGFVCLVDRSWDGGFDVLIDPEFWNPKERKPECLNPVAVRTILPAYLERTKWVLAGFSRSEIAARTKAALTAHTFVIPGAGAIVFMMSRQQYISDAGEHNWAPHLMFLSADIGGSDWGADLEGSPIFSAKDIPEPSVTTFFVPLRKWSDGTPFVAEDHSH